MRLYPRVPPPPLTPLPWALPPFWLLRPSPPAPAALSNEPPFSAAADPPLQQAVQGMLDVPGGMCGVGQGHVHTHICRQPTQKHTYTYRRTAAASPPLQPAAMILTDIIMGVFQTKTHITCPLA